MITQTRYATFITGIRSLLIACQPSHHIPYLYSLAGAASKAQERIRQIARDDYNATVNGLSGVRVFPLLQ